MVNRTIARLAFPGGQPRPKPGPYQGGDGQSRPAAGAEPPKSEAPTGDNGSGPEQSSDGVRVDIPSRR
jgi:linoleoyl-CoA desaturase